MMASLHFRDDLHDIRLGRGPHPGSLRTIIGRYENHSIPLRYITQAFALTTHVLDKLPAIRAMTVERDQHVMRMQGLERVRQQLHIALLGAIERGFEGDVLRIGGEQSARDDERGDGESFHESLGGMTFCFASQTSAAAFHCSQSGPLQPLRP